VKRFLISALILVLLGFMAGCAGAPPTSEPPPFDTIKQQYLARAAQSEGKGDLVEARKFIKLALTVEPGDASAQASLARIDTILADDAQRHYEAGMQLRENGNYIPARREFLTALRLKPDFTDAYKMLTDKTHVVTKKFIMHTVKPGESISKLAQQYYGDYKKYPVIAAFNGISDATDIKVGQEIRIPVNESLKPVESEGETPPPVQETYELQEPSDDEFFAFAENGNQTPSEALKERETQEQDQVKGYRDYAMELFQQQRYDEAASELDKVLQAAPDDLEVREHAYKAHYESAMRLFKEKDYLAARDGFKQSLIYKNDCQTCHSYIKQCEGLFKELHYRNGMKLFQDQNVKEALEEWEMVSSLDANYKRTPQLIEKAKIILKNLEELKKSH